MEWTMTRQLLSDEAVEELENHGYVTVKTTRPAKYRGNLHPNRVEVGLDQRNEFSIPWYGPNPVESRSYAIYKDGERIELPIVQMVLDALGEATFQRMSRDTYLYLEATFKRGEIEGEDDVYVRLYGDGRQAVWSRTPINNLDPDRRYCLETQDMFYANMDTETEILDGLLAAKWLLLQSNPEAFWANAYPI